jgi:ABC-2 type transport system permease protein
MIAVFASLKWRLVTSRLRATTGGARAGMIILFVVLALLLLLVAFGLGTLRLVPEIAVPVLTTLFTLQLVGWILTPLLAFGVDETVDPARFALLPIRPQTLQFGLLTTSLIGYLPVANMIILLGAAVALGVPWSVLPVALVCVIAQLLLCVVLSRAASTSMSALMSSRRGRDLGMALGLVIFLLYMAFITFFNGSQDGSALQSGITNTATVLQWTPPGALVALPAQVAAGEWGHAGISALIAIVAVVLAWWWWATALRRSQTSVPSTTAGSSPARDTAAGSSVVGVGVAGTMRVVAGRDRVLVWRDPMRRMPWLMMLVLTVFWPFLVVTGPGSVYAVALGAVLCGAQAGNQYGVEGTGLWLHLQTITDRIRARGEVLGHAAIAVVPGTVVVLIAIGVQAVVRDGYDKIPAATGVCLAALFGGTAAASYLSAKVPYAQPQSRKSLFASSVPGQKGRTFRATLGVFLGALLVAVPAVVAAVLSETVSPTWGYVALVVGPLIGAAALWFAALRTADLYLEQGPEILAVVAAGDRV